MIKIKTLFSTENSISFFKQTIFFSLLSSPLKRLDELKTTNRILFSSKSVESKPLSFPFTKKSFKKKKKTNADGK